ncbi:MAG: LacI family DNA-binding transcriptional regulator [Solirubrobacteraceae bacterium]|nr:LacI family DNA-binding transcriptional regulator [Solirubrobacteraceae bacterium]
MPERPPTSHDVARLAGVSQPTVSRALRDEAGVSEATKQAVRAAAEQLGYIPIQRGRSLSTSRSGQIAVVVHDLATPFSLEILQAADAVLHGAGQRMLVLTPDAADEALAPRLLDGSLDGAILTTTMLDSSLPQRLARRGLPFVLLNREVDDAPGDVCVVDNVAGGRLAAEELLAAGHREIAALFGPAQTSTGRDREAGFRAALAEAGVALPERRTRRGPYTFAFGRAATAALLETRPTALFCGDDVVAIGAYNALLARGASVPGDVSLIGFDDLSLAAWDVFQLTTVRGDLVRLMRTAAELLLERIAIGSGREQPPPRRVVQAVEIVRRRTVGPAPARRR